MAKPLRGEISVELAGERFTLRLGIGELEEIENQAGMGTIALAQSLSSNGVRLSHIVTVLAQALLIAGKKAPVAKVRTIVEKAGYIDARNAAIEILSAALLDPTEGNADAAAQPDETTQTAA